MVRQLRLGRVGAPSIKKDNHFNDNKTQNVLVY